MQQSGLQGADLLNTVLELWRGLLRRLRSPYRPERHYMRGPGPQRRATHPARPPGSTDASGGDAR